jgi:hypothetical protein
MSGAAPATSDDPAKTAAPASSSRAAAARAASTTSASDPRASARLYAVTTHATSSRLPRSLAITGSAVARIVWSRTAGNIARTIAAKESPTDRGLTPAVGVSSLCCRASPIILASFV